MNTMTNTADFSIDTTTSTDFLSRLLSSMLGLLRLSSGVNSVDADLLETRIVLE